MQNVTSLPVRRDNKHLCCITPKARTELVDVEQVTKEKPVLSIPLKYMVLIASCNHIKLVRAIDAVYAKTHRCIDVPGFSIIKVDSVAHGIQLARRSPKPTVAELVTGYGDRKST